MSEQKQEHAGVSVEKMTDGVAITMSFPALLGYRLGDGDRKTFLTLPTLDSAMALRDALSAFLAFHGPGGLSTGKRTVVDDSYDHCE